MGGARRRIWGKDLGEGVVFFSFARVRFFFRSVSISFLFFFLSLSLSLSYHWLTGHSSMT